MVNFFDELSNRSSPYELDSQYDPLFNDKDGEDYANPSPLELLEQRDEEIDPRIEIVQELYKVHGKYWTNLTLYGFRLNTLKENPIMLTVHQSTILGLTASHLAAMEAVSAEIAAFKSHKDVLLHRDIERQESSMKGGGRGSRGRGGEYFPPPAKRPYEPPAEIIPQFAAKIAEMNNEEAKN